MDIRWPRYSGECQKGEEINGKATRRPDPSRDGVGRSAACRTIVNQVYSGLS